jgi:hypothetical protein
MSLTATVTPGKTLVGTERVTNSKLNQGFAPTVVIAGTADTSQITDDAVTAAKLAFGAVYYCAASTSSNVITLTASGHTLADATLTAGLLLVFKADATNTSTVDIKLSSGGTAKNLYRDASQELAAGDIRSGQMCVAEYDGTQWQLVSNLGNGAWDRYVETDGTNGQAYTATFAPTVSALTSGTRVVVKWNITNTDAVTFSPDGLPVKAVRKLNDAGLGPGDVLDNQISELVYDSTANGGAGAWLLTSPVVINTPATVVGLSRGLVCKVNATNPTYQADIIADDVVLKNASDLSYLASSVSLTVAITSNGANGLDTGAEASSTWYYLWVIYNGSTVAGLISASSTAPTLPSGYTYKALVGAVFNNSGSDFTRFWQTGRRVQLAPANIFTAKAATGANTYQALTGGEATLLAAAVPPIAKTVLLTAGASTTQNSIAVAGDTNGVGSIVSAGDVAGATTVSSFVGCSSGEVPLITAQTVVWKSGSTNAYNRLDVNGYTI